MRNIISAGWYYYGYCEDEAYYYYAARSSDYVLKIDKKTGLIRWIRVVYPEKEEMAQYIILNYNKFCEEDMILGLDKLFSIKNTTEKENISDCVGFKIWETFRNNGII